MSFKSIFTAGFLAIACMITPAIAAPREVGVMNFTFDATHRDRIVQALIFYPSESGGRPEWVGDNVVFQGVPVLRDAMPELKAHPLIVVSHGSGGSAAGIAWLAKRLAEEGYVVAIPNHQGSTSGDSRPETTMPAVWNRPADISQMLDAIAASKTVSSIVDQTNITALGFSLGGGVVLSLAGATFHANRLAKFCDDNPDNPLGCEWLAHGNALIPGHVDLHKIDATKFNASYAEPRISRFIAIDPGMVPAVDMDSVTKIAKPFEIINMGDLGAMPKGAQADKVSAAMPQGHYENISGAIHMDFLPECKALGWFFIWMEGDDPVCTTKGSRSRADIHQEIGDKIIAFLKPFESQAAVERTNATSAVLKR